MTQGIITASAKNTGDKRGDFRQKNKRDLQVWKNVISCGIFSIL